MDLQNKLQDIRVICVTKQKSIPVRGAMSVIPGNDLMEKTV
jgi:hypothetical protein